jgi:hypothetical protein
VAHINIELDALEECLRNGEIAEPLYQQVNKWLNERARVKRNEGSCFGVLSGRVLIMSSCVLPYRRNKAS